MHNRNRLLLAQNHRLLLLLLLLHSSVILVHACWLGVGLHKAPQPPVHARHSFTTAIVLVSTFTSRNGPSLPLLISFAGANCVARVPSPYYHLSKNLRLLLYSQPSLCPYPLLLLNQIASSCLNPQRKHDGSSPVLLPSVFVRSTSLGVPFPAAGSIPWAVRGGRRGGRGGCRGEHRHGRWLSRRRKLLW